MSGGGVLLLCIQLSSVFATRVQEFTEEELRGDQAFSIFLTQCANLISKLQLKIISLETRSREQNG